MGRRIFAAAAAVWLGLVFALPASAAPDQLVPVGKTVGLTLETKGIYVASFDGEKNSSPAECAGLKVGDRILALNGLELERAEELCEQLQLLAGSSVVLTVERGGKRMGFTVRPKQQDGSWRLGLRVRDQISGLGTVTFYDPDTGLFGALGHGVNGGGNETLLIRHGEAFQTEVTGIRRGESGTPGSLLGPSTGGMLLGQVERNTPQGIFGHAETVFSEAEALAVAAREEIITGPAEIWSNISGSEIQRFTVEIEAVRFDRDKCRDLRLAVKDPRLLEQTGGIVQGMSGSPIIQNGKLIGAVTHVLVRDPTRGYGILIGHMLEAAEGDKAA